MQLRAGMALLSPGGRLALRRPAVAPAAAAAARSSRALLGTKAKQTAGDGSGFEMPFKSVLAANRGEIAVRIMRAGNELGLRTVGIFSKEDRFTQHRYKADQAFLVGQDKSPVGAYLDVEGIVAMAVANKVDAIHPGYGFLSERTDFAQHCKDNGVTFVGPTAENLQTFGDKTSARELAIKQGVPVVPGTDGPVTTIEEARDFIEGTGVGYPVIIKAAMGGGGRGMRVVTASAELEKNFQLATSEALAAFGDGSIFIERYVKDPRHIEVQILGDGTGDIVHLYDRDCSVQRRHQKVVETAPAMLLKPETRQAMFDDAVRLCASAKYLNAGTVEFLVDQEGRHYFIEVNPRIQVEHTVTEQVTQVDLVQTQIRIAAGATLKDLGLVQENVKVGGVAMQCRVTTEDPSQDFKPDTGLIEVFRSPGGMGIRIDDGPGFQGANISPHYDSLLMKITASAPTRRDCASKLTRALDEMRVRGVTLNKPFLLNVLKHPDFVDGTVNTSFIGENPHLLAPMRVSNRFPWPKMLKYIADVIVNGPDPSLGAVGGEPAIVDPTVPALDPMTDMPKKTEPSLRDIYVKDGPEAFAKAVRSNEGLLITDTTWRDAHQSLLATRVRTIDLLNVAPATSVALRKAYSLECWGGATFDVSMRFLKECPWDRLAKIREAVPDIPFQMLLRGANAVGYTSYPDNVVFRFCEEAQKAGMDVFRVFDSLNYLENMRLGIDAVGAAGGIVEAAVCYTGDILDPTSEQYNLDYYLNFTRQLTELGIHVLAIKDMAGLLKPEAATVLVSALRREFPDLPIHVHTHDTAGTGVASMLAAANAGADAVDAAMDAMAGTTSQPSMGALASSLARSPLDTGLDMDEITKVNDYWEECRGLYAPFESGQKSGSADVYNHEMPGGQYTNLLFQSQQLGLSGRWPHIKRAYASANRLLGDIIKVLKGKTLPNGKSCFEGRPGAEMPDYKFSKEMRQLVGEHGVAVTEQDLISHAQYPAVFKEFTKFREEHGDLSILDTRTFVSGMKTGQEISVEIEHGKVLFIKLMSVQEPDEEGSRSVTFELNGQPRVVRVKDKSVAGSITARGKADDSVVGSVGAPMPGVVVGIKVNPGETVKQGQPLLVLSAMKMETNVASPADGIVKALHVKEGDNIQGNDLVAEIDV
ncbi:pyruvate carboxylase [Ectocarpus siliculosus]|uniref:Pyruvate carboxylase n=1 Tax=Ectocarpus siliculosus TaxID=2880 RepID=D8LCR8_ECTSI|nr:pyruvate carboxylase [Ectocarpus siliculosus]|eukprot:CBN79581.1 pyruvate carboxylase [Ectocarpus siliculosus]